MSDDTYLSAIDVARRYSVSRVTVWRWTKQGSLPKPVRLSKACVRWSLAALIETEEKRMAEAQG